jgi:hypothetical protein
MTHSPHGEGSGAKSAPAAMPRYFRRVGAAVRKVAKGAGKQQRWQSRGAR